MPGAIRQVEVPIDGGQMRAALAEPETSNGPRPGVVVVHELWGLNDDIRRITTKFAAAGYVALAPDLYSYGIRPVCVVRTMLTARRADGPVELVEAARAWLAERADVDAEAIGAIGFCLGAGLVLLSGTRGGLQAASVNYGVVPEDAAELAGLCPVVASYGADDRPFQGHYRRLLGHLEDLDVPNDAKLYPGATHSFLNDAGAPIVERILAPVLAFGFEPGAAEDAWARIFAFFDEHVRNER